MKARAASLNAAALASRLRGGSVPSGQRNRAAVAFVHRAFWRADAGDGSAEAYIGPVLTALEQKLGAESRRVRQRRPGGELPRAALVASAARGPTDRDGAPGRGLRATRRPDRIARCLAGTPPDPPRACGRAPIFAARSVIRGCDCWPIVREELAGIALLQWPWSARAMDEAAAALDALPPARRRHLRRGRRLGPRARARVPPARHPLGRPAARVHLPSLAELPARAGRDGCRPRAATATSVSRARR